MKRLLKSIAGLLALASVGILSVWADDIPLPGDYVQLEWIGSTSGGHQYINTRYIPLSNDVVSCAINVDHAQLGAYFTVFGAKENNGANGGPRYAFFPRYKDKSNRPVYSFGTQDFAGTPTAFPYDQRVNLVCDVASARWWEEGSATVSTIPVSGALNGKNYMYIFTENIGPANGHSIADSTWIVMKLYSFTIENADGTKVRDYVPCRAPDGRAGLWDKVTGEFYGNANLSETEVFHGSDEVDVFVSYIQSTAGGRQYLNTRYLARAYDVVTCVVDVDNVQAAGCKFSTIFGSRRDNNSYSYAFFTHFDNPNGNYPHYARGQPSVDYMGIRGQFACGCRTTVLCDSTTARWWADGASVTNKTADVATTLEDCRNFMYVFTENIGPENGSSIADSTWTMMKLYSFKIESNGTTVRHLLPYRTAGGKFGAYDIADHSSEDGYEPLYLNAGAAAEFTWGGVAYTREDGGATIAVREGTLSDFDLEGYACVKKAAYTTVNAGTVTNYPALALEQGKFSFQDGATKAYAVTGALALTGGARLAIDLTETANDRLTAGTVNLSGASAENPVMVEIAANGVSALATDAIRPFISGAGLAADDAAKFTVKGLAAEVAFVDGSLVLRGRELTDAVWSGADTASSAWSSATNWQGDVVPASGSAVVFNLGVGGETVFDLEGHAVKGIRIGTEAGTFDHGGSERLAVLSYVTNLSENVQTFTLPLSLGVGGLPFDVFTQGPLSLTGGVTTPGAVLRKNGAGILTVDDTAIAAASDVELAAGVTRINHTGFQTMAGVPGEIRIGPGAQLDLNILQANSFDKAEPVHCKTFVLSGDGPDHEGAIVNNAQGDVNRAGAQISRIRLAGDASIGSVSTIGARIDINKLSGSAANDVVVEGPYALTLNPGNFVAFTDTRFALDTIVDRGYLVFCDPTVTGTITNGVHIKNGATLNCFQATVSAGIPIVFDEGTGYYASSQASTLNGSLTVLPEVTAAFTNIAQVTWAGAVTNNGTIVRRGNGAILFAGALRGSGCIDGTNIRMSETGCWHLVHGDTGWTERVDVSSAADFLPSVRRMDIVLNDTALPMEPLGVCPCANLTSVQVARNIALLTVRDTNGAEIPNCWLDVADGVLRLHVAETSLVRTAVWTGRGVDPDNLADPANWACTSDTGLTIVGGLPMSATTVVIPGMNCTFNCPADAALTYRTAEFTYPVTLAADCDWRGLDALITNTVDLCGHKLYVLDLKGTGTITDTSACYQPVDYIQSTGTQYINTGYHHRAGDKIVCTAEISTSGHGNYGALFGAILGNKDTTADAYAVFVANSGKATLEYVRSTYKKFVFSNASLVRGKRTTITCQNGTATWTDGTTSGTATVTAGANLGDPQSPMPIPMLIFNLNGATGGDVPAPLSSTPCAAKLYSFQIYNAAGELQRDFVPMKKMPEGVGVLYDRVTKQYYENAGTGTFGVGTATDSVQAGELHFDVPAGQSATHAAVMIAGAVRLVKDGAGKLTLSMQNQTYNGGTDVAAGTLVPGATGEKRIYGAAGTRVWVREGATFDIGGNWYHNDYTFVLDGGTLTGVGTAGNIKGWFQHVELTKPSRITGQNIGFVGTNWGESTLEMNGQTLTIEVTKAGQEFYMGNLTVTGGGRIVGNDGGWLVLGGDGVNGDKYVHAETTTLEVPNIGTKCKSSDVRFAGYVASYLGGNTSTDKGLISVTERFTPGADTAAWYDTVLADGVTMDLSHLTQTFNTTCTYWYSGGSRTVTFADGATIFIDFGNRRVKTRLPVISWTDDNKPDDSVTFKLSPGQKGYLTRTPTGIEYWNGFEIFIR